MNKLIGEEEDDLNNRALENYRRYLAIVETILSERQTDILPKQATIFTTNYDLFIEKAGNGIIAALSEAPNRRDMPRIRSPLGLD